MKNTIKILGIIGLMLVIGFSFIACGSDDDSGGGGGNQGGNGTFTLTGIPSEYNGQYAVLEAGNKNLTLYGAQPDLSKISATQKDFTKAATKFKISNGSVSLPLWKLTTTKKPGADSDNETYVTDAVRYTGDDKITCYLQITSAENPKKGDPYVSPVFFSVEFSNGSATRDWSKAYVENGVLDSD